jgi:SAM-dependent methyltransferase
MDDEAYRQYQLERDNWLKVGRRNLIAALIKKSFGDRHDLEILDLGAGVGQNVEAISLFGQVDVVEINPIGLDALRQIPIIRKIFDEPIPFDCAQSYDVIVATDVLEHIEDDRAATKWIADHLRPGGFFLSTVPAFQFLFSEHDVALHHYRRYSASNYAAIMPPEMPVMERGYFNSFLFPIAVAMRLANKLSLKPKRGGAKKQSSIVPSPINAIFKAILGMESRLILWGIRLPFGLSVFCRARKLA